MDKVKELEALALEERRQYLRNWRAKNKSKVKQYNADYWRRRGERKFAEAGKVGADETA